MAGVLYIVATPIGNLEDITLRALRVLKEADLIAAEDTRHTRRLLAHYGISTPLASYYDQVESARAPLLLKQLRAGKTIALVCDAGTPALSDPGFRLIRQALREDISVVPVPGPSALTAVLSVSGLAADRFVFEGFLPAKKSARRERLRSLRAERRCLVFFEAPHRLKQSLADLLEIVGDREVVVAREVTKLYEEFLRGRLSRVSDASAGREWRGEITLMVAGSGEEEGAADDVLRIEIKRLKKEGLRVKEIAEVLGERFSRPKREIYRLALERD